MENSPSAGVNNEPVHCFVAIELSKSSWVVGFQTPLSQQTSRYQVKACDANPLLELIERVRTRVAREVGRPVEVTSCYEAGYGGFWLHRVLEAHGIHNHVLDPASLQINRRARRPKTDRISDRLERLDKLRTGDGRALPARFKAKIVREIKRLEVVLEMISTVEAERDSILKDKKSTHLNADKIKMLAKLKAIGAEFSTTSRRRGILSRICESTAAGKLCGADIKPVLQRLARSEPRHQQGRQSQGARDDGRARMDLVALSTGERAQPLVPGTRRQPQGPPAPHCDRCNGAQAVGCSVALPANWHGPN
jgi:hypothetical protein